MAARRKFTHLDDAGRVRMVNVAAKSATLREAVASAFVRLGRPVYEQLTGTGFDKGEVFATARLAGIQAAKRTSDLIPLCHGLSPEHVSVEIELAPPDGLLITATARLTAKTGVEMEALTAATVAALTVYDMCKSAGKAIEIGPIRLESKTGGKSGDWRRTKDGSPSIERRQKRRPWQ